MNETNNIPTLLKVRDVAKILQVQPDHVYQLKAKGLIKPVMVGGALRFRPAEIERFINEHQA